MNKIGKKDVIQVFGIGLLLVFLILPSYWISEFTLYYSSLNSIFGDNSRFIFPIYFLLFGIIYGLIYSNYRTAFVLLTIIAVMLSCFLANQICVSTIYYYQLCDIIGSSLVGLCIFIGLLLIHGVIAWIGLKLISSGD